MQAKKIHSALFAIVFVLAGSTPSLASQWIEFFHHRESNLRFYYSPESIESSGPYTLVRYYASEIVDGKWRLVDTASIDCINRTIAPFRVDRYDAQSGAHVKSTDLTPTSTRVKIKPRTMADFLLSVACR
ncbi:MAG: hypothetical protein ACE5JU_17595 [Candidatus Binatia bacterium]